MRYDKGHKAATRRRILDVASRRFRRDGVEGVGLVGLMADAGLTHGGFYSHFASKEDLVRATLEASAAPACDAMARAAPPGLEGLIRHYLSPAHRDRPEEGCVAASLAAEIARRPSATRQAFTDHLRAMTDMVADRLPIGRFTGDRRTVAQGIVAVLVGALQLARAVDDPALSDALLADGARAALAVAQGVALVAAG